ncbi:MAG: DUF2273 domain-containing protein [Firmicutes bacterium]|nr:DUF2273 domain-containing protein [Bacillota bacterium]
MWGGRPLREIFEDLLERHRGKVLGVVLGLAVGLLIILFGFWKTVFVLLCVLIGYFLGRRFDEGGGPGEWWERIFRER